MMILKIAFRNIFRQKRRTVLTVLTMFGGFALAAVSIGWSDGSYAHVIDMFTRNRLGHIQIHRNGYLDRPSLQKTIDNYRKVGFVLDTVQGVEAWTPRLYAAGLASVGDKSSAVQVIGINPEKENAATHLDKKIIKGEAFSDEPKHEAIIGKSLSVRLKASPGDEVVIVSQAADGSIANDLYKIVGVIESGDNMADQTSLYLNLADAQDLFVMQGRIHEIAVIGKSLDQVDDLAVRIKSAIDNPELNVATWKEFARSFYRAMKADQQGAWIMLFVIVLVVAVGVLNTVLMTVLERRREYGVLRAIGTAPLQVFRLVMIEVMIMAVISIILGTIVGYAVNYYLSIGGITLPEPFTYGGIEFTKMYTEINLRSFVIPGISVILTAFTVSLFPAGRAARIEPAKAMRLR